MTITFFPDGIHEILLLLVGGSFHGVLVCVNLSQKFTDRVSDPR